MNPVFSADDSRYAYNAGKLENYQDQMLIVDGKEAGYVGRDPVFTADGKSLLSIRYSPNASVLLDGKPVITGIADGMIAEGLGPIYFAKWVPTDLIPPSIVFSRDGKHVAYQAHGVDPKTRGIYLDGKLAAPTARGLYFPTFTPDSQHFFFAADEAAAIPGQVPPIVVYVDGHEAVRANGYFFASVAGSWTMDDQGTLTFFAADGDTVKRYRVTARSDTGIATMIADTSAAQAKALADAEAQKKAADEAAAKAKADKEAAAAQAKADHDAAMAAKAQARLDAIAAKKKAAADAAAAKAQARQDAIDARKLGH